MSFLIIIKAGESLYEGAGMFVGTADSDLSDNGKNMHID